MRQALAVLIILTVSSSLFADDVYLKNGRVFEDVGTAVDESSVTIYLTFGEIGFSLQAVDRIEKAESSHVLYVQRRDALRADDGATAGDWVELARWSRRRELEHGAREAAMAAARLDPQASGLAPLMEDFEFAYSAELGRWVPLEESMRLKGYEFVDGRWMTAEQRRARALEVGAAQRAREADESRRLTNAVLALAAAQLVQKAEPTPPQTVIYGLPLYSGPPSSRWHSPFVPRFHGPDDPAAIPIEIRQPGSLFPIQSRSHHGSVGNSSGAGSASSKGHP